MTQYNYNNGYNSIGSLMTQYMIMVIQHWLINDSVYDNGYTALAH